MDEKREYVPFDQYQRYMTVSRVIDYWRRKEGNDSYRILELGSNEHKDLEAFLPNDEILYTDLVLTEKMKSDPAFMQADGSDLPFEDGSFDFVVSLDVLEHVPEERRKLFFSEASRVAGKAAILSFPYQAPYIQDAENRVNGFYKAITGDDFIWLKEHRENGLPDLNLVETVLSDLHLNSVRFFHGDIYIWEKMWYSHFQEIIEPETQEYCHLLNRFYNHNLYRQDISDHCYRVFYVISHADLSGIERYVSTLWESKNEETYALLSVLLQAQERVHDLRKSYQERSETGHDQSAIYEVNLYFDNGEGYNQENSVSIAYDASHYVDFTASIPDGTAVVRMDMVEGYFCVIKNLEILSDCGALPYRNVNGLSIEGLEVFCTTDPQIVICLSSGISWLRVRADVFVISDTRLFSEMQSVVYTEKQKYDSLREALTQTEAERDDLHGALTQAEIERDNLREALTQTETERDDLRGALTQAEIERDSLREALTQTETERDGLRGALTQTEIERDNLRGMLAETGAARDDLRSSLTQAEAERDNLRDQLQKMTAQAEELNAQLLNVSNSFDTISNAFFWKITKPARLLTDFTKEELSAFLYLTYVKEAAKGMETVFVRCFPRFYSKYLAGFKQKLKKDPIAMCIEDSTDEGDDSNWTGEARRPYSTPPLVSIIVPNYNHAPFLCDRLDSVYAQTYTNYEVILLDDCSTDDSRLILEEYARKYSNNTTVIFNNHNSGRVFTQWNKGISQAKGSLIWIAESDDWCEPNFLESLVPWFEYESVMLAFSRSVFMQDGAQSWTQEEYLADLPGLDFSRPFVMTAHLAVNKGFGVKNIIPNVSSAVFRNTGEIPDEITRIWQELQLCGDWLFYLHIIRGGTIAYTNETTNYYRVHQDSTSLKIQKTAQYYIEQETISKYVASHYKVPLSIFEQVQRILEEHCKAIQKTTDLSMVHENYHIQAIKEAAKSRKPNVLMCGFALQIGGGETYPIVLANEMRRQGVPVTYVNFNMKYKMEPYSKEIRDRLSRDIPLITLEKLWPISGLFVQLGAEVIHSHHGSVDNLVSRCLETMENTDCKQIVTLHGMYETMEDENCRQSLTQLNKTCKQVIYIADKNYQCFERFGYQNKFKMTKIGNGLPRVETTPIPRASLGIEEDAFVLCLASRALQEKGWKEAGEAVIQANRQSDRPIHLVLLGDGEMRPVLEKSKSRFIHVIGQKTNVQDYFAMADMGLLPSYFRGESYPLVLIECMLAGRPVIASEIGEVRHQLEDENGEVAGLLLPIHNWTLDKTALLETILRAANDRDLYMTLRQRVPSALKKFDIEAIVKRHLEIYSTL